MSKPVLCRESHFSALATILVVPEKYPITRKIRRGSDNLEPLPFYLMDFVVLGVGEMIKGSYLLKGEYHRIVPPSIRWQA